MDERLHDLFPPAPRETPETLLDAFRAHPEWSERRRDEQLDRLISRFPADRILAAVRSRIRDLNGGDGEAILRLVEAHATPRLLRELAEALVVQPGLAPERAWEALQLLEGAGLLEDYPALVERRDELDEDLDEEGTLDQLAQQLEEDPEGTWLALQGLGAVEAEVRPQIVEGLSAVPLGPGLIAFLRILAFAHDPATRAAALDALARPERNVPELEAAWRSLALDHPDPEVVAIARRRLESTGTLALAVGREEPHLPRPVRCLVTAIDGQGRGTIVLSAHHGSTRATAAYLCDMERGIADVVGQVDSDPRSAEAAFDEHRRQADLEVVEDLPELALRLLGGSVLLCGPEAPPVLRYWLEETVHPRFRPLPFPAPFPGWDPASLPFDEMARRASEVLEACPTWLDESPLTFEIAEEIALRESEPEPDPQRDAGAYRYLFEHRLLGQLELYRRMLYWMASLWQGAGSVELGHSALALAWQLSDAQHAVPSHPFTVALTTRSLSAAQGLLSRGQDPRRRPTDRGA